MDEDEDDSHFDAIAADGSDDDGEDEEGKGETADKLPLHIHIHIYEKKQVVPIEKHVRMDVSNIDFNHLAFEELLQRSKDERL